MRSLTIAAALLAAVAPAAAQVYRCDAAGAVTYQNAPCAVGAAARQVDTTNAGFAAQAVDWGAVAAMRARERADAAERRAAESAARSRAAASASAAQRNALVDAQQAQADALANIAEQLRLARLDGVGVPGYVGPRRDWQRR
jgi:hypothetical protein